MKEIRLQNPCDMHLHLRDHDVLNKVLPHTLKQFSTALIMPNLNPPIQDPTMAKDYKGRILQACGDSAFLPIMALFFNDNLDEATLDRAQKEGVFCVKLYPQGITTNSEKGIKNILAPHYLHILEIMQEKNMVLCVHGESNGFVLEREYEFLPILQKIAALFPRLRIVLEHVSDARSIGAIEACANLFGTITLHHIIYSLDDLMGDKLKVHLFCKPCLKHPKDRDAIKKVALSAHPKFSFGSDSAPHLKETKECAQCGAGVFSAPVLLPALVEVFEKAQALDSLQNFISTNATRIYNITPPRKEVVLQKKPFVVPSEYNGIVSLFTGETLAWSLV